MGKAQLLLQPGAALAARTPYVSNSIVAAVESAKGRASSRPVVVLSPGGGYVIMACAPSLLPAACSAPAVCA